VSWSGDEGIEERTGYPSTPVEVELGNQVCLPRFFLCDTGLTQTSPCSLNTANRPTVDSDFDGLIDQAEELCGLDTEYNESTHDQNWDQISDHQACVSQVPLLPFFTMRPSLSNPYQIELWFNSVIDELNPQLFELLIEFDSNLLNFEGLVYTPDPNITQYTIFGARLEEEPNLISLTLTSLGLIRLRHGHFATISFNPHSNTSGEQSEVHWVVDSYQVAPPALVPWVTFGYGHPSDPVILPYTF
jgi:hypothetical protein